MSQAKPHVQVVSEEEALRTAEESREKEWVSPSLLKEIFLGSLRLDLITPYPEFKERPEFLQFYQKLKKFLLESVDSVEIDRTGEYPPHVIKGLAELGCFGMKIPKDYDGLGLTQAEYDSVMKMLGSVDGNITALLSAHQSIGVPQPLKVFGSPELKKKYLPRIAKGSISAFALTEPDVGSDPARLTTTAELSADGQYYIINGSKLWCTNATIAELLVVMARDPKTRKISAFVVEMAMPGVSIDHRCHFMGLRALANGVVSFKDVKVPRGNLIGKEGQGLKIALVTLNTGRLALPAGAVGAAKRCVEICRDWANKRVQWGHPVGKHEAVANMIAEMGATTFAMEAVSDLASRLADRGGYDIRLEAAAAKEFNSVNGWRIIDNTMQIRGGRGYETEISLAARGDEPIGVERMMRDSRINMIFEGSSEIMHLYLAREALDKHLSMADGVINIPGAKKTRSFGSGLARMLGFYAAWYPTRWLGWGQWPRFRQYGKLATHLRFAERNARRLSRNIFHGMIAIGPKLQYRQGFLFRSVDIGLELLAISAVVTRAYQMQQQGQADETQVNEMADLFCRMARRRVRANFKGLWSNDDVRKYKIAQKILGGNHLWLEAGGITVAERLNRASNVSSTRKAAAG